MPTKKRGKESRSAKKVIRKPRKTVATARRAKPRTTATRTKTSKVRAKASRGRTPATGRKVAAGRAQAGAKARGASSSAEIAALKSRFQREKGDLEKRLTETVREIGQLRHHEARVSQLERQLKEREETIGQLRAQVSELRNRELEPLEDEEAQPSLALGSRPSRDLDDLEEDLGPEDDDELI